MKKLICFIFCELSLISYTQSQNLVPNYSFEIDTACAGGGKIYYAVPWFQPNIYYGNTTNSSSSDLYGSCASSVGGHGVPINGDGFQYARTGGNYSAIYCYRVQNSREYIEVPLLTPLIANNIYCVEYYVSLGNNWGAAISNMGAYFSVDSLLDSSPYQTIDSVIPQIENLFSNMLSDTLNWMLVSGSFVAAGGEKFMTIGNFRLPANTNTQIVNAGALNIAKYDIDDVSVVDCTGVGVGERDKKANLKLYPNPNNGSMSLEYHIDNTDVATINIYNIAGSLIKTYPINSNNSILNIDENELSGGIYYYNIRVNEKILKTDKIVIIK